MDIFKSTLLRFLRRKKMYRLNQKLLRRAQQGMGIDCYGPMETSGELSMLENILSCLPKNPAILDIGANSGDYSQAIMRIRPDAILHSFEPNPRIFPILKDISAGAGFSAHNLACGLEPGRAKIYDINNTGGGGGSSRSREVMKMAWDCQPVSHDIEVINVDQFLDGAGIDNVSFVKIDVEGYELDVLKSMTKRIAAGQIDYISFEFNIMNIVTRTFMKDFVDILPGWSFSRILPDGLACMGSYDPLTWEIFGWQNIVAIRKSGHTS